MQLLSAISVCVIIISTSPCRTHLSSPPPPPCPQCHAQLPSLQGGALEVTKATCLPELPLSQASNGQSRPPKPLPPIARLQGSSPVHLRWGPRQSVSLARVLPGATPRPPPPALLLLLSLPPAASAPGSVPPSALGGQWRVSAQPRRSAGWRCGQCCICGYSRYCRAGQCRSDWW